MFRVEANNYIFTAEEKGHVYVYKSTEGVNSSPVYISNNKINNQKEFEIEISYIMIDHLNTND